MKLLFALLIILNILNVVVYGQHEHDHTHYDKYVIKGPGCSSNGELIKLGECMNSICGSNGTQVSAIDMDHGEFKIQYANDAICKIVSDLQEFTCLSGGKSVPVASYNIVCYEEDAQVAPKFESFTMSGPSCDATNSTIPSVGQCVKVCGGYSQITEKVNAVSTFAISLYGETDTTCSTVPGSTLEFICDKDTKTTVGSYEIQCIAAEESSASPIKVFSTISAALILLITLLF